MIVPPSGVRVLVATKPVDFRKGIDGLAALVQEHLRLDPYAGTIYVFRAKRAEAEANLKSAEAERDKAWVSVEDAKREYDRQAGLFKKKLEKKKGLWKRVVNLALTDVRVVAITAARATCRRWP